MKKSAFTFLAIFIIEIFSLNVETFSQYESIFICGVHLKIGMNKEEILSLIANHCIYTLHNDFSNIYTIWDSNDKNRILGFVTFDSNDKINYISKKWFNNKFDSCSDAWELLFKLLTKYQNKHQVTTNTKFIVKPEYKAKSIEFLIGERNITVIIQEDGITDIDESLSKELLE
ncbi:MAG: hypothetical protein OEM46_00950 [Ignavibacteria bacterium]|nr:hypothetical protein [Ignavibacteria bacterium]